VITRRGLLLGAAAFPAILHSAPAAPVVRTTLGRLRGRREGGLSVFRGIRYAIAERFQAPKPPPASRGNVEAFAFGPSAPQRGERYKPQSEDCLYLNVWTPDARSGGNRPVMVYFHGGAYSTGSVADPLNDGRHLAARGDVVVVTVNHRFAPDRTPAEAEQHVREVLGPALDPVRYAVGGENGHGTTIVDRGRVYLFFQHRDGEGQPWSLFVTSVPAAAFAGTADERLEGVA